MGGALGWVEPPKLPPPRYATLQKVLQGECLMKLFFATDEISFHLHNMGVVPCLRDSFTKKTDMFFLGYKPLSLTYLLHVAESFLRS